MLHIVVDLNLSLTREWPGSTRTHGPNTFLFGPTFLIHLFFNRMQPPRCVGYYLSQVTVDLSSRYLDQVPTLSSIGLMGPHTATLLVFRYLGRVLATTRSGGYSLNRKWSKTSFSFFTASSWQGCRDLNGDISGKFDVSSHGLSWRGAISHSAFQFVKKDDYRHDAWPWWNFPTVLLQLLNIWQRKSKMLSFDCDISKWWTTSAHKSLKPWVRTSVRGRSIWLSCKINLFYFLFELLLLRNNFPWI